MDTAQNEYEILIHPIEDRMINSVWRITRDPDDADDAFQDALTKIWKQFEKIRRHPNPQALILRICANSAYDVLRRKNRYRKLEELYSTEYQTNQPSTDELALHNERKEEIFWAISKLSRNQAASVLMRFIQELPYSEIALALRCAESTARRHIARAKGRLYKLLSPVRSESGEEVKK
ncbi:RNA polymerase sigma factor [candidate division KSB1 bacterium]